ncbi:MAG: hypothetical protein ACREUT_09665 [Steroidobacteraceae bacterium]
MSPRTSRLLLTALGTVLMAPTLAGETSAQRVSAFAALPNWTGLWMDESGKALLLNDFTKFRPPALFGKPPYNAEFEKKLGNIPPATDQPPTAKTCQPVGFPYVMAAPVPDVLFELLVTPEQTLLIATDETARHIYTDGRSHPEPEDLWPTAVGDSIGHWEGGTLVIDTIARKAGPVVLWPGAAELSDQAHFTERLHLVDANTMQDDMTIDDPQRFSHPWQVSMRYLRVTDFDRMVSIDCAENDRNPVVNGRFVIAPPK